MPKIPNTPVLLAITIAVIFFIGYLWYKKLTGGATEVSGKPIVEPSEYVNLLVGFISLAVAIIFGIVATNLSNKANKYSEASFALANKQDSLHEELNELRNLASGQQEQLNELLRIVVRLDTQNQLSVSQIDELKIVTSNLGEQTGELRALNTKQVEVSETISKQFAVNSGILQYILELDKKKFNKAQRDLMHGVNEVFKVYNSSQFFYRDYDLDSIPNVQELQIHQKNVSDLCKEMIKVMEKYGGNVLLDYARVENSWRGSYLEIKKMSEKMDELLGKPYNESLRIQTLDLLRDFAFWANSILDNLSVTVNTHYEDIFQIDKNLIESLIPQIQIKRAN
ncbi:MAG: hypothetical protein IT252_10220 [Chitinophagaceae bacterium]|nr:hypothetical protein [Chitinophagaceae bacterium]